MFKIVGGNNMKFGETLKNLRDIKGITQKDLAEYLEVSRATVAGYETKNHQPDYEKLEKIARYFDVSIDYLLTGDTLYEINIRKHPINERLLDAEVLTIYKSLSTDMKQDALKYLKLLEQVKK